MKNTVEVFDVGLLAAGLVILGVIGVIIFVIRGERSARPIEPRSTGPHPTDLQTPSLLAAMAIGVMLALDFWRMWPVIAAALTLGGIAGVAISSATNGGARLRTGAASALLTGSGAGVGWFLLLRL